MSELTGPGICVDEIELLLGSVQNGPAISEMERQTHGRRFAATGAEQLAAPVPVQHALIADHHHAPWRTLREATE